MNIKNVKPVDDLELFELIVAAYPDKFDENAEGCIWDEVMEFAEDKFGDLEDISEFLGRIALLTMPANSAISGETTHCLGKVEIRDGQAFMTAAVQRKASI
ncbi:hypothetical protein [Parendozoicomonas sp. Alg238-R29]|uniref:hypothetical protein n=1 Tax=Parendozoicomonas sp. Alg238-R29 TaxID=2993446 RepID=UPI00248D6D30|nr:hypothetical protein [Parendozoicomonas sp. Alg238-R29]